MKIRCEQNSVRFRLRKSELVQLKAEQWLTTALHLPNGATFSWELVLDDQALDPSAAFSEGVLRITIPQRQAMHWMDSEAVVGLEYFQPLGEGQALHILVEKDFPCKDRADEDQSDFFAELAEDARIKC
ncbi:MAG: hypothetical protein IT260_17590 [Saprospiraceae bacterium]|nr:hypothetical protein [Saprospiraceae bacterium]